MTKVIKILGTGCPKCEQTAKMVKEVIAANNIAATVEKVEDIMKIMEYNVLSTPAVVVDEKIVVKGRVPSKNEILTFLS